MIDELHQEINEIADHLTLITKILIDIVNHLSSEAQHLPPLTDEKEKLDQWIEAHE